MSVQATHNSQPTTITTPSPAAPAPQSCWEWITTIISSIFECILECIRAIFACLCCCDRTGTTNTTSITAAAAPTTPPERPPGQNIVETFRDRGRFGRPDWANQLEALFRVLDQRFVTDTPNGRRYTYRAELPGYMNSNFEHTHWGITIAPVNPQDRAALHEAFQQTVREQGLTLLNDHVIVDNEIRITWERASTRNIAQSTLSNNREAWANQLNQAFHLLDQRSIRYRTVLENALVHSVPMAILQIHAEHPGNGRDLEVIRRTIIDAGLPLLAPHTVRPTEVQERQPDGTYRRNAYLRIVLGELEQTPQNNTTAPTSQTNATPAPTVPSSTSVPTPPRDHRFLNLLTNNSPEWVRQLTLVFQALNTRFGTSYRFDGDDPYGLCLEPAQQQDFEEFHQLILNNLTPEYRNKVSKWRSLGDLAGNNCTLILFN